MSNSSTQSNKKLNESLNTQGNQQIKDYIIPNELLLNIKQLNNNIDISNSNKYLTDFISMKNFDLLKYILFNLTENSIDNNNKNNNNNFTKEDILKLKIFSITSINNILLNQDFNNINTNFLNFNEISDLYACLLTNINDEIYINNYPKYFKNLLIKCFCTLVRITWFKIAELKNVLNDIVSFIKEDNNFYILITSFEILKELVYIFQTNIQNQKQFNKKVITEFKDIILLQIFDYAYNILNKIFLRKINILNFEMQINLINEIVLMLNEVLDFEEDLNIKLIGYKKYELKTYYIPNNKKRCRDKSIDFEILYKIINGLFDFYTMIIKYNCNNNNNNNLDNNNFELDVSGNILNLLQKFLCIKFMYLGNNKNNVLKIYMEHLCTIMFNKYAIINSEQICYLIYSLKKNYSIVDIMKYGNFIIYLINFFEELYDSIKTGNNNNIQGFNYLLRVFGLFSQNFKDIYNVDIKTKIFFVLKNILKNILNYNINNNNDIEEIYELSKGFGMAGICIFNEILEKILEELDSDIKIEDFNGLSLKINFAIYLIKENYDILFEKKLQIKNEEDFNKNFDLSFSLININETSEIKLISDFIIKIFNYIQNTNFDNKNHFYNITMIKFLKFFIKYFFDKNLINSYIRLFNDLYDILKMKNTSDFLCDLIYILVKLYNIDFKISENLIIKSINYICKNISIINNFLLNNNIEKINIYIGKIELNQEHLIISIQNLFDFIITQQKLSKKILSKLLQLIFIIYFQIYSPFEIALSAILYRFNHIQNFNLKLIIFDSINKSNIKNYFHKSDILFKKICEFLNSNNINLNNNNNIDINNFNFLLKFLYNFTNIYNKSKIFEQNNYLNNQNNYELFLFCKNLLQLYYNNAKKIKINSENEKYIYQIKPIHYFLSIFLNIFHNFIQIPSIINNNENIIFDIFNILTDFIFSIDINNFFGYFNKLIDSFAIIKLIYCDNIEYYIKTFKNTNDNNNENKINYFFTLIINCYEYCDIEDLLNIINILNDIIYKYGKYYIEKSNKDNYLLKFVYKIFNDPKNKNLFQNFFKNLINKIIFNDEIICNNLDNYSKLIFILSKIYDNFFLETYCNIIRNFNTLNEDDNKFRNYYEDLINTNNNLNVYMNEDVSLLDSNYEIFNYNLKFFHENIKDLVDKYNKIKINNKYNDNSSDTNDNN